MVERLPFCVKRVKTDNGAAFRRDYRDNDPSVWTLFQLACWRYKIKHILNKPGSPWENAYVEGQHRLEQERFYATLIVHNEDEAREKLAAYDQRSLCYRKSNLNGRNPLEMVDLFRQMVKEAEDGRL